MTDSSDGEAADADDSTSSLAQVTAAVVAPAAATVGAGPVTQAPGIAAAPAAAAAAAGPGAAGPGAAGPAAAGPGAAGPGAAGPAAAGPGAAAPAAAAAAAGPAAAGPGAAGAAAAPVPPDDDRSLLLTAWAKNVDVQQHFNQLEMEVRRFAITVVVATIGAAGVVAKDGLTVSVCDHVVSVASILVVAGAVAWVAFGTIDYFWYHRFLIGAVKHAGTLEAALQQRGLNIRLAADIRDESRRPVFWIEMGSRIKLALFYLVVFVVLVGMAYLLRDVGVHVGAAACT